jgi:hypothetical protein
MVLLKNNSEEDNIEGTADTDDSSDGDVEGTKPKSYTLISPALDVVESNFPVISTPPSPDIDTLPPNISFSSIT